MQRKNYLLKTAKTKMRNAMAMIMAIIVLVVIGTLMSLSLSMTAETGKRTTDLYLYEQTVLYSKSAAELALLAIALDTPCNFTGGVYNFPQGCTVGSTCIYSADVNVTYVYSEVATCAAQAGTDYFTISTDEQNGSVLMDITVTTNEGTEPIRYFRRSIQKL